MNTAENTIATLEQAELLLRRSQVVNNEQVEGKALLDICGYSYTDKNWGDKLNRQIQSHNFKKGVDFIISQSPVNGGAGNRGVKTFYHFTINAANHILLAAMTPEGKQARQEAIDLKTQAPDLLQAAPANTAIDNAKVAIEVLKMAKAYGFEGNQALLSADKATRNMVQFSPLEAMEQTALISPVKAITFTPTQLGESQEPPLSPREFNKLLEAAGMQTRVSKTWEPTEKGADFCEVVDTGKVHSSTNAPVKQIKWYASVVDYLHFPESDPVEQEKLPVTDPVDKPTLAKNKVPHKRTNQSGIKPHRKKQRREKGIYNLDGHLSIRELAQKLKIRNCQVQAVLEKKGLIKKVKPYKSSLSTRLVLTNKGWKFGRMYDPSKNEFHAQDSKRLFTSNAQPVFDTKVINYF